MVLRADTHGRTLSTGDNADVFVRPEAIRISLSKEDLAHFDNQISGQVTSILFNGADSRVLVASPDGGDEIEVNLPQSGEFSTLSKGAQVHIGWASDQGNCFATGAK